MVYNTIILFISLLMKSQAVSVIGLGKLGLPFATAAASRGFSVFGFDVDKALTDRFKKRQIPNVEPHVSELFTKFKNSITITDRIEEAVLSTSISFIIVPTPSKSDGSFSSQFVEDAVQMIIKVLEKKHSYHLISIVSTLSPRTMNDKIKPILRNRIGLCYNPSFIALGNVVHNLLFPDFILIGESDKKAGVILSGFYKTICQKNPPILRMNFINAEIAKLALNTYMTTKISYANMLGELCDKLPGSDVYEVTQAIGFDPRVGHAYLRAAASYGGPCFPRDNRALAQAGKAVGVAMQLAETTDEINTNYTKFLGRFVSSRVQQNKTIGILGLSYKPDTDVTVKSQGVELADYFTRKKYTVMVYDPVATHPDTSYARQAKTLEEIVDISDVLVITTAWKEFSTKLPKILTHFQKKLIIVDCWRVLNKKRLGKNITCLIPGKYTPSTNI